MRRRLPRIVEMPANPIDRRFRKYSPAFVSLLFPARFPACGQDQDAALAPAKTARTGYLALKPEDLPRDAKGFLKAEIWDIIAAEAKANPNSNEARVL